MQGRRLVDFYWRNSAVAHMHDVQPPYFKQIYPSWIFEWQLVLNRIIVSSGIDMASELESPQVANITLGNQHSI
jgi:hypothetical protein